MSPSLPVELHNDEDDTFRKQLGMQSFKPSFIALYRYASVLEIIIVGVSSLAAVVAGACQPLPTIVFAHITNVFISVESEKSSNDSSLYEINRSTLFFLYIMILSFITQFISTAGFMVTGERITRRIKERFMEAVLRQNIAIFDEQGAGDIITQLTSDSNVIQSGISHKLSLTLAACGTLGATLIICFFMSWKLTFMLIWAILLGIILFYSGNFVAMKYGIASFSAYALGGTVVEETFGSIKSVTALGMQQDVVRKYDTHLKNAARYGFRLKAFMGSMIGFAIGSGYLNVALAFWQGSRFLTNGQASFVDIVTISLAIKSAAFSVLGIGSNAEAFASATAASSRIFSMIERISPIDPSKNTGEKPIELRGHIEFLDVKHKYPSRPDMTVAEHLDLTFLPGTTTAIVGSSGAGKSTIINLIERFYDPLQGRVLLDGRDITTLNLQWLRQQIRTSSQEPILMSTTVYENIEHGLTGTVYETASPGEKQSLVRSAARLACVHEFILTLPDGYQTQVGSKGSKLSGGQKQRISIARAVVANPKILILDEATSALDRNTEAKVQAALRRTAANRTTLIVAHRLSTIRDSDKIIVLDHGRVVESGTHVELMDQQSAYYRLVEAQANNRVDRPEAEMHDTESEEVKENLTQHYFSEKGIDESASSPAGVANGDIELVHNKPSLWVMANFIARFNKKESHIIILGLIASFIAGGEEPASAILLGKSIVAISLPRDQLAQIRSQASFYSYMFLLLALVQLCVFVVQGIAFAFCSERLIERARHQALEAILYQDISWYEKKENSPGALTSFLSTEVTNLAGISGSTFGTILIASTSVVTGFIVGVSFGWKLGLVCATVIPILLGCGFYGVRIVGDFQSATEANNQISANYASEAVSAIRTVAAFTREREVLDTFRKILDASSKASLRSTLKSSLMYATAQSLLYGCMGLGFWYGGRLIIHLEYSLFQFTVTYMSVIMSAFSAGLVFSFAPSMGSAANSAFKIHKLLSSKPSIDARSDAGKAVGNIIGSVEFRNVSFRYPARPDHLALDSVSFKVKAGSNIALVGETGSGKSTVVGLLERFYDITTGSILVDGVDITTLNVRDYRRSLGLVIQEPTLYEGSIRENLIMGIDDQISDAKLEQVCKEANIYDFVMSLPTGLDTSVGISGCKLSGGQKQRLAIARALVRNPRILLLDEATSAVDSQSEALIQEALERMNRDRGRTTITIAHRLSTVRNADVILVLKAGNIVESGRHEELVARKGYYWDLLNAGS